MISSSTELNDFRSAFFEFMSQVWPDGVCDLQLRDLLRTFWAAWFDSKRHSGEYPDDGMMLFGMEMTKEDYQAGDEWKWWDTEQEVAS